MAGGSNAGHVALSSISLGGPRTQRVAKPGRSRQKKHGGGKFKSEKQRRYLWAVAPKAAKKWAHNKKTRKGDWRKKRRKR